MRCAVACFPAPRSASSKTVTSLCASSRITASTGRILGLTLSRSDCPETWFRWLRAPSMAFGSDLPILDLAHRGSENLRRLIPSCKTIADQAGGRSSHRGEFSCIILSKLQAQNCDGLDRPRVCTAMADIVPRENRKSFAHKFPWFASPKISQPGYSQVTKPRKEQQSSICDRTEQALQLWKCIVV